MSWWVYLVDEHNQAVEVEKFEEGGTREVGGTDKAELNITFNYNKFYKDCFQEQGLMFLHNKKAKDVIEELEHAVATLGTNQDNNYWASTPGNAGYALSLLLKWAKQHPKAIFVVR